MSKNISQISYRQGLENNLFESLTDLSSPTKQQAIKQKAHDFLVGEAVIYGSRSFYDFIEGDNANKKAYVCNGSSCLCAGSQAKVLETLQQSFKPDQIGHVCCLGRCHENSAFQIDGNNYSGSDLDSIKDIIAKKSSSSEQLHCDSLLAQPVLTQPIKEIQPYYQLLQRLESNASADDIVTRVINSGLRGRGGAGFPAGIKWQSCMSAEGDEKYIVCNADEGDPGAFTDRYLLQHNPHSVLFGMLVAGWLCQARYGVLYIRDEYPAAIAACKQAITDFNQLNLNFNNDWRFNFKIIRGAGAYICGEETALLNSIEGQRPMVSVRPPFPTVEGLFGRPTILNNVETFASIHYILDKDAEHFKQLGTDKSSGTKLLSLDSCVNKPGVYEVEMGTSLDKVIYQLAGGFSKPIKALHIGGPLGGIVPLSKISDLSIDFESFEEQGFLLGHGSIIGIPESYPLIDYLAHLFEFTAEESCGKCFPCRLGATRGKEMFYNSIHNKQLINRELLDDLLDTMEQGSLCALGGGVPLPIKNSLEWFAEELEPWFENTTAQFGERIL